MKALKNKREEQAQRIYAARNRTKGQRKFFTFEAMWNVAKTKAKEKWGASGTPSMYVHMALHAALVRDGFNIKNHIELGRATSHSR